MASPRLCLNRYAQVAVFTVAMAGWFRPMYGQPAPAHTERVPVLVELFTSEGCSDCPPADTLLAELDAKQPIPGAQVIVLSEHVTYWNHEGWTDPFSMDEMTVRQQEYVDRFRIPSSYTPETVVDGAAQMVGNNGPAVVHAIANATVQPKQQLSIDNAHWENGAVQFAVRASSSSGTKLVAVLAADATHAEVARGENAGRTLHHVAVVRVIKEFNAEAADGRPLRLGGGILNHKEESSGPIRLVTFLVDRKTGHVVAAAEQTLSR
jgi:hypothetical protein